MSGSPTAITCACAFLCQPPASSRPARSQEQNSLVKVLKNCWPWPGNTRAYVNPLLRNLGGLIRTAPTAVRKKNGQHSKLIAPNGPQSRKTAVTHISKPAALARQLSLFAGAIMRPSSPGISKYPISIALPDLERALLMSWPLFDLDYPERWYGSNQGHFRKK
jgi:hypothetical protein